LIGLHARKGKPCGENEYGCLKMTTELTGKAYKTIKEKRGRWFKVQCGQKNS